MTNHPTFDFIGIATTCIYSTGVIIGLWFVLFEKGKCSFREKMVNSFAVVCFPFIVLFLMVFAYWDYKMEADFSERLKEDRL